MANELRCEEMLQLLVTANVVPNFMFSALIMKATRSSETSFLQEAHGVTFHKTAFFLVTFVKTSNLT
jgi:hypothetical protein